MVKVIRYNPKKHYSALYYLHVTHGIETAKDIVDTVPKLGYIVFNGDRAICAGFLRRIEGKHAQFDTFVSNKHTDKEQRHEGLTLLVDKLLETAKKLKLKSITAYTVDNGTLVRAMQVGFVKCPHTVIALPLPER